MQYRQSVMMCLVMVAALAVNSDNLVNTHKYTIIDMLNVAVVPNYFMHKSENAKKPINNIATIQC